MLSIRASQLRAGFRFGAMAVAAVLLSAGSLVAQVPPPPDCLQSLEPLLHDTSSNCLGLPTNPKFFETTTFSWSGSRQLLINNGNELQLWRLTDPQNPTQGELSSFGIDNQGDSDYDLLNYTVCDDCRWGAAAYKKGNVIFDLWGNNGQPGTNPDFAFREFYPTSSEPLGSFTFKVGNQQYLLANFLPNDCGGNATLYELDGMGAGDFTQIGCLDVPDTNGKILNGFHIERTGTDYLYLGFTNRRVYIYEIQEFGNTINLFYTGNNQMRAYLARGKGMQLDHAAQLAITTLAGDGMRIWDISNPASPVQRSFRADDVDVAGIRYPFAWTARSLSPDTNVTYNIENPSNPVVLDQNFWHPEHPWNSHVEACEWPQSATFSDDGNTMYLARYSVVQMIDFTACAGPIQPTANMTISPDPSFPGDLVTLTDTSIGTVDEWALWITPSSDPGDTILEGYRDFAGQSTPVTYQIPANVLATDEFWAHVAVRNVDFPCDPLGSCPPQQLLTRQILIDRAPEAFITIDPVNPITGDLIDLIGSAEGSPGGSPVPFHWRVEDPDGNFDTHDGQIWTDFPLDQSGDWQIRLRVDYLHEVEGGGSLYQAQKFYFINDLSSVAADFTLPFNPLSTDPIVLDGNASNWTPGATLSWSWSVTGATTYNGCANSAVCVIPADTLNPGIHTVQLTLVNTDNGDTSVSAPKTMNVVDGTLQLGLSITDATPDIGQTVIFDITGVPGDVDEAHWNFGGTGCTGYPQTVDCILSQLPAGNCDGAVHQYASAGAKTITLTIKYLGQNFTLSPPGSLTVQNTGSCDGGGGGGGGGGCTYSIMPDDANFDASGGSSTVIVNTQTGCPWTAVSNNPGWITITSGSSGSGQGTVNYSVDENAGQDPRTGTMVIAGRTFTVDQAGNVPTDFSISNTMVEIGEEVTFVVDAGLTPSSWDFGAPDCGWSPPTVDCSASPSACQTVGRTFAQAGLYNVTLETTTGSRTRTIFVRNMGDCSGFCGADFAPDPTFSMAPNPVQAGLEVEFFHSEDPSTTECAYTVEPESMTVGVNGANRSITVATTPTCQWFASDDSHWITITSSPLMGTGSTIVNFRVDPNDGDARTGRVFVGGHVVSVNQEGSGGTASSGGGVGFLLLPIGLTVDNPAPDIGESVTFEITGYAGDVEAHWDFGGTGCPGFEQEDVCEPLFTDCLQWTYKYNSAGPKIAEVTAYEPGTTNLLGSATVNLTVQNAGSCGGGDCTYAINPTTWTLPIEGGSRSFSVSTQQACTWDATTPDSWITITDAGSGVGSDSVTYSVAANGGAARQGRVEVRNLDHIVNQSGSGGGGGGGGGGGADPATEWLWTITKDGETVHTSTEPNFTRFFIQAGLYQVELEAINCAGSSTTSQVLEVLPPPPPDDFLVPAAAHAPGLNDTVWRTDLRMFNPCVDDVDVTIEYLPDATNNANSAIHGIEFMLESHGTTIFHDIVQQIPGIVGDDNKGSLRFTFDGGMGCSPLIASRTYNDTPEGTFGQFVPAVPVQPLFQERVFLTGLVHNLYYRTNIGLANFGSDDAAGIVITVYDEFGEQLGNPITTWVPGFSTRQIVEVIEAAGILVDVDIFSVAIDPNGADLTMYGSLVDNITGDPVLYTPGDLGNTTVWIPGIAHLPGANDSLWRSDITFLNDTDELVSARVEYVPERPLGFSPFMTVNIQPGNAWYYVDVLGVSMLPPDTDSKGYFVVKGLSGSVVPNITAKTYNLADQGGTFGQNLKVFGENDLVHEGEAAYIPGVANSSDTALGFRTNVGVLNIDPYNGATISIKVFDTDGNVLSHLTEFYLAPAQFLQSNVFDALGIGDMDIEASLEIRVLDGGPVAAYASEIDNRTQDPILVPAVPVTFGTQ